MLRTQATQFLRDTLDKNNLQDWHIRLVTDLTRPFLGMCSYRDKCIILNAHHIDTHGELEVKDTILHEVAHALCNGHGHDDVWKEKAKELGASPFPCAVYGFSEAAIDAIRSGADLEVTYEERVVREPKYKITRLQDKCPTCGKVAKEKAHKIVKTSGGYKKVITLECLHIIIKNADSQSPFEDIVFDADETCKHEWGAGKYRTRCIKCNAKRLYDYQVAGARALEAANGRLAIFDEMGLGKTIQALAYLKYNKDSWPFLWVTKSGVKFQHAKEIIRVLGFDFVPQVILTGKETLIPGFKAYVVGYDIFRRLPLQMFEDMKFKAIILDECQAIKNPDSTRTQCVRKVAKNIPKIIPLSGTFWKNRGSEAFVTLNLLDPGRFYSFEQFKQRYVDVYWEKNKQKEGGFKNPKQFRDMISDIAIRRERKEVMPELPLINRTRLLCQLPEYARKAYDMAEAGLVKTYNDAVIGGEEESGATALAIMQSLMVMKQIVGIAKVDTTVEFAKEFLEETDRKLVIFVHHIECGKMIYEQMVQYCQEENLPAPLQLTGGMSSIERGEAVNQFNSPNHRLLIASTLASGEGLNLQSCSDCIMHERQWNPANEEQAEGRFIRIGQEAESVTATYVHADATVDMDLDEIVERKRIIFHNSMNKGEMPTWNEKSIVQELAAKIAARSKKRGK